MKLLERGTGNQKANKRQAVQFVVKNIIEAQRFDGKTGEVVSVTGETFMVSAYAESSAAFVSTPGHDRTEYSIYASGCRALMVRQIKNDGRVVVYQIDPKQIPAPDNSNSVQWPQIEKAAEKIWVHRDGRTILQKPKPRARS